MRVPLKKWIKRSCIAGVVLLFLAAVGLFLYIHSAPSLPTRADQVIDNVLQSKLPELIQGKTLYATNSGIKIWCESISPVGKPKGAILLINGVGADALTCEKAFYQPLLDAGYNVIRFDYRGTGWSDWINDWDPKHPYSLQDMANDCVEVLDALRIRKANVIGMSLGGRIGMYLALDHPERAASLT